MNSKHRDAAVHHCNTSCAHAAQAGFGVCLPGPAEWPIIADLGRPCYCYIDDVWTSVTPALCSRGEGCYLQQGDGRGTCVNKRDTACCKHAVCLGGGGEAIGEVGSGPQTATSQPLDLRPLCFSFLCGVQTEQHLPNRLVCAFNAQRSSARFLCCIE